MKVWVEIVAVDGRRIKTPVREDYEDHRDDDPICTADVVARGFTYWVQNSYFDVPEHLRAYTRLGRALHAAGFEGVRSLGCIAHAGGGLYSFTVSSETHITKSEISTIKFTKSLATIRTKE